MYSATVALFGVILLVAGSVLLQVFLSKRESKWPGLILPLLSLLISLLLVLNVTVHNGEFPWGPILASLILGNIPTVILLAIYFASREKFRKRSELDKMNIKDL